MFTYITLLSRVLCAHTYFGYINIDNFDIYWHSSISNLDVTYYYIFIFSRFISHNTSLHALLCQHVLNCQIVLFALFFHDDLFYYNIMREFYAARSV